MKAWNHYICTHCDKITVARHDQEGVTPFMLECYYCGGMAQSTFFEGTQDNRQIPHVIFYRPKSILDAVEAINKEPEDHREWWLDHYRNGGALMKKAMQKSKPE